VPRGTKRYPVGQLLTRELQATGSCKALQLEPHEHEGKQQRLDPVHPFDGEGSSSLIRSQLTIATIVPAWNFDGNKKASFDEDFYPIERR
jgi:hypothetical protein